MLPRLSSRIALPVQSTNSRLALHQRGKVVFQIIGAQPISATIKELTDAANRIGFNRLWAFPLAFKCVKMLLVQ
jgi:hypothetical protein